MKCLINFLCGGCLRLLLAITTNDVSYSSESCKTRDQIIDSRRVWSAMFTKPCGTKENVHVLYLRFLHY